MTKIKDPPPGCQEIPGVILSIGVDRWLTKTGQITDIFRNRGVWPDIQSAQTALDAFFEKE